MRRKSLASAAGILLAVMIVSASAMGCSASGSSAQETATAEAEAEEEVSDEEELLSEETEDNHDVTAGYVEEGDYYCEALIGEDDAVSVSVFAPEESVIRSDTTGAPELKESSGTDLDKARRDWLLLANDGDEEGADLDMTDFEGLEGPDAATLAEIMNYSSDLSKLFYQFDVTDYDFSRPAEVSEDEYIFDVYTSGGNLFYLDLSFDGGVLYEMDFQQELL